MNELSPEVEVCVVGGGSAGIGAALAAARAGRETVLIEAGGQLGGNAVRGGVHNWEPGVGGTAFPQEIYERLRRRPNAVTVWSFGRHWCWPHRNHPPFPGGEQLADRARTYADTLQRHGTRGLVADPDRVRKLWHGIVFEPDDYAAVVEEMLAETGCCHIWKNLRFASCEGASGRVGRIHAMRENGRRITIRAPHFIDATADGLLCRAAGCESLVGEDSHAAFREPSAPDHPRPRMINAVTLIYRITPRSQPAVEPLPAGIPAACWFRNDWGGGSIGEYACGDRNINMLPTMEGSEFLDFVEGGNDGFARAYAECRRRVLGHWHFLQVEYPEFQHFRLKWIAPTLGVRETRRIIGEYALTEQDLHQGLSGQRHHDIVAIADHALDIHGQGDRGTPDGCPELSEPYGIPFRCLVPKGWRNLLVAGRCASFSHIAASSCRLSRTMMDLGHAAGLAAAQAVRKGCAVGEIDIATLRASLAAQGATLAWRPRAEPLPA